MRRLRLAGLVLTAAAAAAWLCREREPLMFREPGMRAWWLAAIDYLDSLAP